MTRILTDNDKKVWEKFTKNITILGKPLPSNSVKYLIIEPPKIELDLHGKSLTDAYISCMSFVDNASSKYIMIITGLSGQIKKEFKYWFDNHKTVKRIEEINSGGAYKIYLK